MVSKRTYFCLSVYSLINQKRLNRLGCNVYRYLCLGPGKAKNFPDPPTGLPEIREKQVFTVVEALSGWVNQRSEH